MISKLLLEAGKSTFKGNIGQLYLARCRNCESIQVKSSKEDDKVFCSNCKDAWMCGPILSDSEIDEEIRIYHK